MRSVAKLAEPLGVAVEDLIGHSAIGEWGVQLMVSRDDGSSSLTMSVPRAVAQRLREVAESSDWNLTAYHVALAACRERREFSDEVLEGLYQLAKAGVGLEHPG